jgi:hypothetical protein
VEQPQHVDPAYYVALYGGISVTTIELELKTASAATLCIDTSMKALVYHGPRKRAWENKPRPTIQEPGDAIVRISTSTICGTIFTFGREISRP